MAQRNDLDTTLLGDLKLILQQSPLLWEAYLGLPENQRDAVDDKFLRLIWDTIMAAVTVKNDLPENPLIEILDEEKKK